MSKIPVINIEGKAVETVELDPTVFDGVVNDSLMHQAIVMYLANQRKGLACSKTKGEVSGGGKKPWRQKGTGRARVGSNRSPLWRGGGVTFGPRPHSFDRKMPKRMKSLAFKSALNAKFRDKELIILDKLNPSSAKTKEFAAVIKGMDLEKTKVIFVVDSFNNNLKLSHRNLKEVKMETSANLNPYTLLNCKKAVFTKDALAKIQERVKKCL